MSEIRNLLAVARRRLEATSLLRSLHVAAVVVAPVVLLLMVADRAGASTFVPWVWVGPILALVAIGVGALLWSRGRRTEHQVALAVDERLDLAEKISTALYCRDRQDPFARAAVEDAVAVASRPQTREVARRRFRVTAPRGWWISPVVVLVALGISLLQPLDLFAGPDAEEEQTMVVEARQDAEASVEAVVREIRQHPELSRELDDLLGELSREGFDPDVTSPEQVRREAIKKMSEVNKRLDELLSGEQSKTAEALRQQLQQLQTPADGPGKELAEAMARGDFAGAKKAIEKLMNEMQEGKLDAQQQEQLGAQLENLANQLEQMAAQQQQLEQALQQAGLDPKLAQNPQALEQALQNNPNLNQQQKQQLQQMARAQQQAQQMCQNLGQACQQMAQQMMQGQMGQAQQAGQKMADQLNQAEMLQQMLQQAQAAANACQGQAQGLGQGLAGLGRQQGGGAFGGRGQGKGGRAPVAPTPWGQKTVKADGQSDPEGDIIARMFIDGPEYVGESRKQAMAVVAERLDGYDEALAEEKVPPQYRAAHQHYFGELKKMTEASEPDGSEEPAEAQPEPESEEPAEDDEGSEGP